MRDVMELAGTPVEEECVQVNKEGDYHAAMKAECRRFKDMLEKRFPNPPAGVSFKVTSNPHDFGTYYECAVVYDDEDEEGLDFALMCEGNLPARWTDAEVFSLHEYQVELHVVGMYATLVKGPADEGAAIAAGLAKAQAQTWGALTQAQVERDSASAVPITGAGHFWEVELLVGGWLPLRARTWSEKEAVTRAVRQVERGTDMRREKPEIDVGPLQDLAVYGPADPEAEYRPKVREVRSIKDGPEKPSAVAMVETAREERINTVLQALSDEYEEG